MFRRIFGRQNVANQNNVRETNVRQLDGQFIIIVARKDNGMIDYRYEDDRTNTIYSTLEAFCR